MKSSFKRSRGQEDGEPESSESTSTSSPSGSSSLGQSDTPSTQHGPVVTPSNSTSLHPSLPSFLKRGFTKIVGKMSSVDVPKELEITTGQVNCFCTSLNHWTAYRNSLPLIVDYDFQDNNVHHPQMAIFKATLRSLQDNSPWLHDVSSVKYALHRVQLEVNDQLAMLPLEVHITCHFLFSKILTGTDGSRSTVQVLITIEYYRAPGQTGTRATVWNLRGSVIRMTGPWYHAVDFKDKQDFVEKKPMAPFSSGYCLQETAVTSVDSSTANQRPHIQFEGVIDPCFAMSHSVESTATSADWIAPYSRDLATHPQDTSSLFQSLSNHHGTQPSHADALSPAASISPMKTPVSNDVQESEKTCGSRPADYPDFNGVPIYMDDEVQSFPNNAEWDSSFTNITTKANPDDGTGGSHSQPITTNISTDTETYRNIATNNEVGTHLSIEAGQEHYHHQTGINNADDSQQPGADHGGGSHSQSITTNISTDTETYPNIATNNEVGTHLSIEAGQEHYHRQTGINNADDSQQPGADHGGGSHSQSITTNISTDTETYPNIATNNEVGTHLSIEASQEHYHHQTGINNADDPQQPGADHGAADITVPSSDGRFHCPEPKCFKSFTTSFNLRNHHKAVHKIDRFKCRSTSTPCGEEFRRSGDRTRHEDAKHLGKRWRCQGCRLEYKRNPTESQQAGCERPNNQQGRHDFKVYFKIPRDRL